MKVESRQVGYVDICVGNSNFSLIFDLTNTIKILKKLVPFFLCTTAKMNVNLGFKVLYNKGNQVY